MRKTIDFVKAHPLITCVIGVAVGVGATKVFRPDAIWKWALLRIILTMAMSMFIYLVSKERSFENCHSTTGYIMKWTLITQITSVVAIGSIIHSVITGEYHIADGWFPRLLAAICLAVFVGLFEEMVFRVLINDALLYSFRNSKHIFVWIAVISSLMFGIVHVIGGGMPDSPAAIGAAVFKLVSCAVDGFILLLMYWKTRNIWGVALTHALWDLSTFIQSALTESTTSFGGAESYTGAGVVGIVIYSFQIIIGLIALIIVWNKVGKTIDFEEIRKNW